ncbi:MAG: hypothetical protein AAF202_11595, partial [Pseudomonadota bacterium]
DGVHTNGTAIAKINKVTDKDAEIEVFLNALYSEDSLLNISRSHYDFPASISLKADTFIGDWGPNKDGEFLTQGLSWDAIGSGESRADAIEIMQSAGWQ